MSGLQGPFIQIELDDEEDLPLVRIGLGRLMPRRAGEANVQKVLVQVETQSMLPRTFEIPLDKARELLRVLGALL
jgi:hypothetical protein